MMGELRAASASPRARPRGACRQRGLGRKGLKKKKETGERERERERKSSERKKEWKLVRMKSCLFSDALPLPLRWRGPLEVRELLLERLDVLVVVFFFKEEFRFFLLSGLVERKKRERKRKRRRR